MFDIDAILQDAAEKTSTGNGTVGGSAKAIGLGSGLVRGNIVVDISAIKVADNDEKYVLHLMGGSDASFTQEFSLVSKEIGHRTQLEGNLDDRPETRLVIPFQNECRGMVLPYVRIRHVLSGTSPRIVYTARMEKNLEVTGKTNTIPNASTTTTT